MDIFQFSNVDEVLGFNQTSEQLKMVGNVRLFRSKSKVLFFIWNEFAFTLENQSLVFIVLKSIN